MAVWRWGWDAKHSSGNELLRVSNDLRHTPSQNAQP
jgi:hypothetical protein